MSNNIVEVTSLLKKTNIIKDEEQKIAEIGSTDCELRENTDIDNKDLNRKMDEKTENNESSTTKEIEDSNACLESIAKLSVDPKLANDKLVQNHAKIEPSLNLKKQQLSSTIEPSLKERQEPQVKILSLSIISPGREDVVLTIPFGATTSKTTLFTLKEGSKYRIKFHLSVSRNTVHKLKYTYMVWKSGLRVNQTKKMVGTFEPREEPYVYELEEDTTPSGFFARGSFLVKSKFVDDDDNCYLETTYYFDIRKDWGVTRDKP